MLTIDEETKLHREVHLKAELEPSSMIFINRCSCFMEFYFSKYLVLEQFQLSHFMLGFSLLLLMMMVLVLCYISFH